MNINKSKYTKGIQLIWIISVLALFFHGKIPFMLPFSVLSMTYVGIFLLLLYKKNRSELKQNIYRFAKQSWAYGLLGLIFLIAAIFTLNRDPLVLKESLYVFYIWVIILELHLIYKRKYPFNFLNYFSKGYLFFLFILLLGFYYNLLKTGNWFGKIFGIATDYNYLALGLLIAVPLIVYEWSKTNAFWKNLLGAILLFIVFIPVFGSGSRRGLVIALLVQIGLLIYLYRSFRLKQKSILLIHYFTLLLIGLTAIIILFGTVAPQVRILMVNRIFPHSEQSVKTQYSSISYRYSTIRNDTLDYKELFDKQWKSEPLRAKGFGSKLIKHYLNSKLNKFLEYKEYDRAWYTFIELRNFCLNEEAFLEIVPEEYKNKIPEAVILSDSLIFSPHIYPIPFLEKAFFDFSETQNVRLLSSESNNSMLTFESLQEGKIFLKSNFIFVPQTENTLTIDFKGIKANNFKINFYDEQNTEILLKEKVKDSILENGLIRRQIHFLSPFDYPKLGKIKISAYLSSLAKFEIGKNEYCRIPTIEKPPIKSTFLLDNPIILSVKDYVDMSLDLDSLEKNNLLNFIVNPSIRSLKFTNYCPFGRIIEQSDSVYTAESPLENNFARISCKVPSLPGIIYKITFNIESESIPVFNIKRYPENDPYDFQFKEIQKSIMPQEDGRTYTISYQYSVEKSTSGYSLLVVGVQNASKFEKFRISDFSFKLVNIERNVALTALQKSFYQPILAINGTEKNNKKTQLFGGISKYLASKDNRIKRLTDLQTKNRLEFLPITELQRDSIHQFIAKANAHPIKFKNYGASSEYLKGTAYQQLFRVPENGIYARAYSILPAIINIEVDFECKFIGNSKPIIYTKRSPETNPYTYSLVTDSAEITPLTDTSYLINYIFQVKESNSGIGIIVIGYENALKNEKFRIADAKYKLTSMNDHSIQLNSFQYSFLHRLIVSENSSQAFAEMNYENSEIVQWRDSLRSDNNLFDSRLQRWKFAVFYFNQLSWTKKLFGAGFNYLNIYPIVFPENGTNLGPDYPHNPIISSFLYSGLLGGFFYIYFLGLSFYRYWRLRKELALFGLLYSLAFAFTFFSGNSHFSVPAFTLLSLLPFAFPIKKEQTNSLDKLEKQELSSKP